MFGHGLSNTQADVQLQPGSAPSAPKGGGVLTFGTWFGVREYFPHWETRLGITGLALELASRLESGADI